jgi:hypothetical protein
MVAGLELADAGADLFDHARRLVAQDCGSRPLPQAVDEVQIAATDARGRRAEQDLAILWIVDFNLLDAKRLVWTMENSGFHFWPSVGRISLVHPPG